LEKILGHSNNEMTERYATLARQHIARTNSSAREMWKLVEPICEAISANRCSRIVRARNFYAIFSEAKSLKILVARDGIEPPTPAFSGPLTESPKWFENNGYH